MISINFHGFPWISDVHWFPILHRTTPNDLAGHLCTKPVLFHLTLLGSGWCLLLNHPVGLFRDILHPVCLWHLTTVNCAPLGENVRKILGSIKWLLVSHTHKRSHVSFGTHPQNPVQITSWTKNQPTFHLTTEELNGFFCRGKTTLRQVELPHHLEGSDWSDFVKRYGCTDYDKQTTKLHAKPNKTHTFNKSLSLKQTKKKGFNSFRGCFSICFGFSTKFM